MREGTNLCGGGFCRRAARSAQRLGGEGKRRHLGGGAARPARQMLVACAVLIAASAPGACASHTPVAAWQSSSYPSPRAGQGRDVLISPPAVHHAMGKSWSSPGQDTGAMLEGPRPPAWSLAHEQQIWADIAQNTPKTDRSPTVAVKPFLRAHPRAPSDPAVEASFRTPRTLNQSTSHCGPAATRHGQKSGTASAHKESICTSRIIPILLSPPLDPPESSRLCSPCRIPPHVIPHHTAHHACYTPAHRQNLTPPRRAARRHGRRGAKRREPSCPPPRP